MAETQLMPIGGVSKRFGISTRTLRYYEQIGLLRSVKTEASYRFYDQEALERLRLVIVLRKLRIPLGDIARILDSGDARAAVETFRDSIAELDAEVSALLAIRKVLLALINRLSGDLGMDIRVGLLSDEKLLSLADALTVTRINFKEEKTMEELNKAEETLAKLTDVRIAYLPPATVASSHHIGPECEHKAGAVMEAFVRDAKLWDIKPDIRSYGFNHPNEVPGEQYHGYEFWTTIPDDMDVPAPLVKKRFPGGLYAAHMIKMGDFHEWEWFYKHMEKHPDYDLNTLKDNGECMFGLLEECLNYVNVVKHSGIEGYDQNKVQLDLLIPIKPKSNT